MQEQTTFTSVLKNPGFLNLWINQILVQLSYNALNFTLILWVYRLTNSNTAVSALLFCVYLPAVIFGLFAGVLVDVLDRRKIIRILNLALAVLFASLIFLKDFYPAILIVAFLVNTMSQFYTPCEASAIPILVKRSQLLIANSLFTTTLFSTFLVGFGLAGPLINHLGLDYIFGIAAGLLVTAFLLTFLFPPIVSKPDLEGKKLLKALEKRDLSQIRQIGASQVKYTLRLIKTKLSVLFSILIMSGVQVVIGILAVLIPSFFEKELSISATDVSQVLILPLGLGMVIGGFIIGRFGHRIPKRVIVGRGILVAGILFLVVGIAPFISPVIRYFNRPKVLPFFYQPSLSSIMAVGSFLLGIAMVSIIIPSQTVIQENTAENLRGKVFSVLAVVMQGASLIPVLTVGITADLFGTMPIFIAIGGTIALLGLFAIKPDFYFAEHHLPFNLREFLGLGHWKK